MNDTAKERLDKKSDIDSGMTAEQKRKVYEIETRQADDYNEHAVAVDDRGKVVGESVIDTHKSSGWIIPPIGPYVRTHNHPDIEPDTANEIRKALRQWGQKDVNVKNIQTLAGKIGIPLSGADVGNTVSWGNKEVRARTGNFVFSMRNADNRVGVPNERAGKRIKSEWQKAYKAYTQRHYERGKNLVLKALTDPSEENIKRFMEFQARINTAAAHHANKEIAIKYRMTYTRKRVRDNN